MNWRCDCCRKLFESEHTPTQCPLCEYYHCGDFTCCTGMGFTTILTQNEDCEICLSIMDNHADNLKDAAEDCPVHSQPGAMDVPHGTIAPPEAEETKPGKIKKSLASPTAKHLARDKEDVCFHGAMFNPNCPVCILRKEIGALKRCIGRWQSGDLIEGDFVADDGSMVKDPYAEIERLRAGVPCAVCSRKCGTGSVLVCEKCK